MKKLILAGLLILLCIPVLNAQNGPGVDDPVRLRIVFDQMLTIRVGVDVRLGPWWGLKVSGGIAPFGLTMFSGDLVLVRHILPVGDKFGMDIYAGIPLLYGDFLEGNVIDWDPDIDQSYWGLGGGGGIVWSLDGKYVTWALSTGAVYWREWQGGQRKLPRVLPHVFLELEI